MFKLIPLRDINKFYKRGFTNGIGELQLDINHAEMSN